jgi:hypothetical protein
VIGAPHASSLDISVIVQAAVVVSVQARGVRRTLGFRCAFKEGGGLRAVTRADSTGRVKRSVGGIFKCSVA